MPSCFLGFEVAALAALAFEAGGGRSISSRQMPGQVGAIAPGPRRLIGRGGPACSSRQVGYWALTTVIGHCTSRTRPCGGSCGCARKLPGAGFRSASRWPGRTAGVAGIGLGPVACGPTFLVALGSLLRWG